MKVLRFYIFILIMALPISPAIAQEPLLAIEFSEDDQEGFDLWPESFAGLPNESTAIFPTDAGLTSGQTTVVITSNTTINIVPNRSGAANAALPDYTYENLYSDIIHAGTPTGALTLTFSGLNPTQSYRFTLYAWDPGSGEPNDKEWTVIEGTTDQPVQSVNFQDVLTDNESFALAYDVTTTSEGSFTVTNTNGLPQSAINGFTLASLGAPPSPLEITSISFSPADSILTLTWNSISGQNYNVSLSEDLEDWTSVFESDIPGDTGTSTTKIFDLNDIGFDGDKKLFFRVEPSP